jgi:hypothetical protein
MNLSQETNLLAKLRGLSPSQLAELEDFVDFLAARSERNAALERLLSLAPGLEEAGAERPSEDVVAAEVAAVRAQRRAAIGTGSSDADSA